MRRAVSAVTGREQPETLLLAGGGTGGHVFPLVAVAEALRTLRPSVHIVFVGTSKGIESKVVPERGFALELMHVVPIRGGGFCGALRGIGWAGWALPEARSLIRRLNPRAVLSIGGYAAGPISLAARWEGIPLALIEPNAAIGLANQLVAPLVSRAYTAFPEPETWFRKPRVLRTGVPLRTGFHAQPYVPGTDCLRLLVLGGSQGAKSLNNAVPRAVAQSRLALEVVHQCGTAHAEAVRALYQELGCGARAKVVPFIDDMPAALAQCDIVVSRSGASAVSEICAMGRPSLLVPFPFAAADHQLHNALSLERAGAAICVRNEHATPTCLAQSLERLVADRRRLVRMAERALSLGKPEAAITIACDLLALAALAPEVSSPSAEAAVEHPFPSTPRSPESAVQSPLPEK